MDKIQFSGNYSQHHMEAICTDIYNDYCSDVVLEAIKQARAGNINKAVDLIDEFAQSCRNKMETYRDMVLAVLERSNENRPLHVIIMHDEGPLVYQSRTAAIKQQKEIQDGGGNCTIYEANILE